MTILGIGGFEDLPGTGMQHVYSMPSRSIEEIFSFSDRHIPLQFFPLHLIGHDSSAAVLVDGRLVAYVSEERLTRVKHGFNLGGQTVFPRRAIAYCLEAAAITWDDVDYVAHYCSFTPEGIRDRLNRVGHALDPKQRLLIQQEYECALKGRLARDVVRHQLESIANRTISEDRFIQVNHHLAHAAGAFYSSDFGESLILTLDGYGEEESSIWAVGVGNRIDVRGTVLLPVSLGLLYQVVTAYLGFRSFGDEYKVMGLASYGDCRKYRNVFDQLVISSSDGTYRIETLSRIDLLSWLREAFGDHAAHQGFSMKTADIAAALQAVLEKTILAQLSFLKKECGASSLCLSGGVALNACMNSAILRSGLFRKTFIQPAAGDDGASLGAALYTYHDILCHERSKPLRHVNWGPAYGSDAILSVLRTAPNVRYWKENDIEDVAARLLSEGKTVGWFQGRMEMGPRALGGRSILADPRSVDLRDRLNVSIKSREFFRPFAPSVLQECAAQFFEVPPDSSFPFMLITFATRREMQHVIPGVVHVDGSARIQTVSQEDHPRFYRLLQKFHSYTGIPLLLNTSFNRAGEPIVCSPRDALQCFLKSGLNVLVMEDFLILNDGGDL